MPDSGRQLILKPTPFDHGLWTGLRHWRFAKRTSYRIGDRSIAIHSGSAAVTIDAADITEVSRHGSNVSIHVDGATHVLRFLRDADAVADALRALSRALRMPPSPQVRAEMAMASDRLNDLVGLWQQGLITDAEYEAERRHFS